MRTFGVKKRDVFDTDAWMPTGPAAALNALARRSLAASGGPPYAQAPSACADGEEDGERLLRRLVLAGLPAVVSRRAVKPAYAKAPAGSLRESVDRSLACQP